MSNKPQTDKAAPAAQTEAQAPTLADWQTRVVNERGELTTKATKLREFIGSKEFDKLDSTDQHLLRRQLDVMAAYALVLQQRIDRF